MHLNKKSKGILEQTCGTVFAPRKVLSLHYLYDVLIHIGCFVCIVQYRNNIANAASQKLN